MKGSCGGWGRWIYASSAVALTAVVCLALAQSPALGSASELRQGGIVRLALQGDDLDSLDPALSYSVAAWNLVDATCALLLRPAHEAHGLGLLAAGGGHQLST